MTISNDKGTDQIQIGRRIEDEGADENFGLLPKKSFSFADAFITEAGLSFLGLGMQLPEASWGSMIRDGTRYMLAAPHLG